MRRIAVVLALMCSSTAISAAPTVVYAAAPPVVVENIAHTQVIQTTGPASGALSWGLDRIDQRNLPLSGSYSYAATGAGVKAYIVDSGIKANHAEFTGRVASGWSYRSASQSTLNTWRTYLGSCKDNIDYKSADHPVDVDEFDYTSTTSDVGSPDNEGHGTHVAGIIGGTTTGVAKGVTLVPVRVLNSCGEGLTSMVLAGLDWILVNHQLGEPAVVNMSIGFDIRDSAIDAKIAQLLAEGIVVTAAAGNSGTSACDTTPAATPGTISVGASSSTDTEPEWSNYGTCVDMYAPGVSIPSTWHYQGSTANPYLSTDGTSMAAPHVAGVVARYLQGVVTTSTTETDTWSWLDANMTTGKITRYVAAPARTQQTPNKLLAVVVPDAVSGVTLTPSSRQISATWTLVAGLTYVVTSTPGGGSCTTTTSGCVISGLTNDQDYTIAVAASNSFGSSTAVTVIETPNGVPEVPATATSLSLNKSISLSWGAVVSTANVTYVVTSRDGTVVCRTTQTSCVVDGLLNGVKYDFAISTSSATGQVAATSLSLTARPGFTVKKTEVVKKSSTLLSRLITSVSTGKKTWKETGTCSIVRGRFVAANRKTTCRLFLSVAKTSKYPAMSTRVTISVK